MASSRATSRARTADSWWSPQLQAPIDPLAAASRRQPPSAEVADPAHRSPWLPWRSPPEGPRWAKNSEAATDRGGRRRSAQEPPDAQQRRRADIRLAASALLGVAALFTAVRMRRTEAFDLAIALRIQADRSPGLARLMWAVSQPGFPPLNRILPVGIVGLLRDVRRCRPLPPRPDADQPG